MSEVAEAVGWVGSTNPAYTCKNSGYAAVNRDIESDDWSNLCRTQ